MKKSKLLYISMSRTEKILGWLYMAFSLLCLPAALTWVNGQLADPLDEATLNFVFYLTNFLFIAGIFFRFLRASLVAAWRDIWNFIQAVILGYVAYLAASKAMEFIMPLLMPGFSNINDAAIAELAKANYTLMLVGVVFLAPVAEEMLYRGLIFRQLWQSSKAAAYLVSMAAFAAIHVLGYIGSEDLGRLVLCFIQYLPAGLCLAWTYTKADNIVAPMVVHAIVNAVAIGALR